MSDNDDDRDRTDGHPHDRGSGHVPHDWHSRSYVDYWIKRDGAATSSGGHASGR